jgi:hypothetical protein
VRDKPVASLRQRFDKLLFGVAGPGSYLAELVSQLIDATAQRVLCHDDARPDGIQQLLSRDDPPGMPGENAEHLHDLGFQTDRATRSRDRSFSWIDSETANPA